LLQALLEKTRDTSKVDEDQYDFINDLIAGGTADLFDKAAQVSTIVNRHDYALVASV
jgi:hypothetical protein